MKPFKLYKIWNKTLQLYHSYDRGKYTLYTAKQRALQNVKKLWPVYKEEDSIELHEFMVVPMSEIYKISNALTDIFNDRWQYMPPRKGEVHCKHCGKRSWWSEDEEHESYCPVIPLRAAFDYIQTSILENMREK